MGSSHLNYAENLLPLAEKFAGGAYIVKINKKSSKNFVIKFSLKLDKSRVVLYNVNSRKTVGKFSVWALAATVCCFGFCYCLKC